MCQCDVVFVWDDGVRRDLNLAIRRQRQVCIRDRVIRRGGLCGVLCGFSPIVGICSLKPDIMIRYMMGTGA